MFNTLTDKYQINVFIISNTTPQLKGTCTYFTCQSQVTCLGEQYFIRKKKKIYKAFVAP